MNSILFLFYLFQLFLWLAFNLMFNCRDFNHANNSWNNESISFTNYWTCNNYLYWFQTSSLVRLWVQRPFNRDLRAKTSIIPHQEWAVTLDWIRFSCTLLSGGLCWWFTQPLDATICGKLNKRMKSPRHRVRQSGKDAITRAVAARQLQMPLSGCAE